MKRRMLIAMACGLAAVGINIAFMNHLERTATGGKKQAVVVVRRNIEKGVAVSKDDLALRMIPAAYIDERAVKKNRMAEVVGAPVALSLRTGTILNWSDFDTRAGQVHADLSARVAAGMRAVTIPVSNALALGGLLQPNHRVDIIAYFGGRSSNANKALTLLQNVAVLATGDKLSVDTEAGRHFATVTLSVSLEDAELLSVARESAVLSIALRGNQDLRVLKSVPEKTMTDILSPDPNIPGQRGNPKRVVGVAPPPIERLSEKR